MNPHILKIEIIADSRLQAIVLAERYVGWMRTGTSLVDSSGPDGRVFSEVKPFSQGQKSLAKITHDEMGQRVKVEYPEDPPFGAHIPHPVTAEEAGA